MEPESISLPMESLVKYLLPQKYSAEMYLESIYDAHPSYMDETDNLTEEGVQNEKLVEKISGIFFEVREEEIRDWLNKAVDCDLIVTEGEDYTQAKATIHPNTNWAHSTQMLMEIINGVGEFYFGNRDEFRNSIPVKTDVEVFEMHLHYIAQYGEVYGEGSLSRCIDDSIELKTKYI